MAYDTTMFIEIEGTKAELRALQGIAGLDLERGASDLGGGRFKVGAMVRRKGAMLDIQARGLAVRVIMDEAEVQRRIDEEQESFRRRLAPDASSSRGYGDQAPPAEPDHSTPMDPSSDGDKPGQGPKGAG
jgi:hypothetical protein